MNTALKYFFSGCLFSILVFVTGCGRVPVYHPLPTQSYSFSNTPSPANSSPTLPQKTLSSVPFLPITLPPTLSSPASTSAPKATVLPSTLTLSWNGGQSSTLDAYDVTGNSSSFSFTGKNGQATISGKFGSGVATFSLKTGTAIIFQECTVSPIDITLQAGLFSPGNTLTIILQKGCS